MEGLRPEAYGDAFADVYDEWYAEVTDVEATVAFLADRARRTAPLPVLELGVGTGRLALPLSAALAPDDVAVRGLDASVAMLDRLRAKPGAAAVEVVVADMADLGTAVAARWPDPRPHRAHGLVFVAFNTLFNLTSAADQGRCLEGVAGVLAPDGRLVVEAVVPAADPERRDVVTVRSRRADHVVLSVSRADPDEQRLEGRFVELVHGRPVRRRPWSLRYAPPEELDGLAAAAGLVLEQRWGGWRAEPFTDASDLHVSVYRRAR